MYILISVLLSFIYVSHIFCATSSTPVLSPIIHTIFSKSTADCSDRRSLTDLLQNYTICALGQMYMDTLHKHAPYVTLMCEIARERSTKTRKSMWRQLDLEVYQFLTDLKETIKDPYHILTDRMKDNHVKGLVVANVLFQQEWLTQDPESFDSIFHGQLEDSESSQKADSASNSSARVPHASSKRHVHRGT